MRRSIVVAIALLAVAFVFVGGPSLFVSPSTTDVAPETEDGPPPDVFSFEDAESGIWPYLSARESHDRRSPINVVVRGETDEIVRLLAEEGDGDWEETPEEFDDAESETFTVVEDEQRQATGIAWGDAQGTTRYAWIDPGNGEPARWETETLQLDDGDYYGYRYHIRLYESPNDDQWVAMQTHSEHFDWFTLRHRVDGVEEAQSKVEAEFIALPGVDTQKDVRRINLENAGPSDANGWATVVDLVGMAIVPVVIGLTSDAGGRFRRSEGSGTSAPFGAVGDHLTDVDRRRLEAAADRVEASHLVLAMTILALVLGVRIAGIALERHVDLLTPHQIAGLLYPVMALGVPIATYALASRLTRRLDAAVVAATSLAVATWLDYGLLGVDSLPIDVVVQRMFLVVALGLIAGGAARRATRESRLNDMLIAGVGAWVVVLLGTLFGYL